MSKRRYRSLPLKRQRRQRRLTRLSLFCTAVMGGAAVLLQAFITVGNFLNRPEGTGEAVAQAESGGAAEALTASNGRPRLDPLPQAAEVWECEVVVLGGTLGGIAAASHAMRTGVQTCMIELTPWLGGQISSQGVSALDESRAMRSRDNFSPSWEAFKQLIRSQPVTLPDWTGLPSPMPVYETNNCWVGELCFSPKAGANAAEIWMRAALESSPESRWATSTAFKGATFDASGRYINAVYAVRRIPRDPNYAPEGRLSRELSAWYSWSPDDTYNKVPIRLQAPPGRRLMVIDATDTGELVGWANFPHRVGSDAQAETGEVNAASMANPDCTQAYTYPFILATMDDGGSSYKDLQKVESAYSRQQHRRQFDLEGFPFFDRGGVFNYRRMIARYPGTGVDLTQPGEMTLINWNRGNDWHIMEPPLILTEEDIVLSGQRQNWLGGVSLKSLQDAENHALIFAEWLIETQAQPYLPLSLLTGPDSPMGTRSGLSMVPYFREGRRIFGRPSYGQDNLMLVEADLREDMTGGRNFSPTAVALAHYDIDIHGCRYWDERRPTYEASSASIKEFVVRPLQIPLEAMLPQGVENVLIGGKSIAVSHIVNGVTRVHYGEWSVGAAAGATSGWLLQYGRPADLNPSQIVVTGQMPALQQYLMDQGLRFTW
jgi:hypothetical protein